MSLKRAGGLMTRPERVVTLGLEMVSSGSLGASGRWWNIARNGANGSIFVIRKRG